MVKHLSSISRSLRVCILNINEGTRITGGNSILTVGKYESTQLTFCVFNVGRRRKRFKLLKSDKDRLESELAALASMHRFLFTGNSSSSGMSPPGVSGPTPMPALPPNVGVHEGLDTSPVPTSATGTLTTIPHSTPQKVSTLRSTQSKDLRI